MLADGGTVLGSGVAGVVVPSVEGKLLVEPHHAVVAVGLGEDGGGGDGEVGGVALDDAVVGNDLSVALRVVVGIEAVAVDDEVVGTHGELVDGTVHGGDAGTQDVHLVNLLVRDDAHGPTDGIALNLLAQLVALSGRQLLRVVQQGVLIVGSQNHGGGIHRSGQTATPGLVAAGNPPFPSRQGRVPVQ